MLLQKMEKHDAAYKAAYSDVERKKRKSDLGVRCVGYDIIAQI